MSGSRWRDGHVSAAWFLGAIVLILLATLPPQPDWSPTSGTFFRSLLPHNLRWRDVTQNLFLYCPLGVVLGARAASVWTVLAVSAGLSLATELLQYAIPGRDPAARDVLVNALGALFAYSAARSTPAGRRLVSTMAAGESWLVRARDPGVRQSSQLLFGWALALSIALASTAALLRPAPLSIGGLAVASPFLDRSRGPLRIGSSGAPAGFFKGTIDEVRIYDSARTSDQIAEGMLKGGRLTAPADTGLIAAYGFNSNTGNMARDDTGRGHEGVVSGATWTPEGRHGGALRFDGSSSEVVVPSTAALDLDRTMTLEAWVLASEEASAEATVIGKPEDVYYLRASSNTGPLRAAGGGRFGAMPRFANLAEPFRSGEWTHLATTYDGQTIRLYVNGVLSSARVHWSPHHPERALLDGVELAPGLVPDATAVRNALTSTVTLEATLTCGTPNDRPAPAFLIGGLQSTEPLALIASGDDLFVKPLTRARRFGLASPATRVSGAMNGCAPGRRLPLTVSGPLQNPVIRRGDEALGATTPTFVSGWAFLIHFDLLPAWVELTATMVWLSLLAIPLGLWARWNMIGAVSIGLVTATLLYIPSLFHVRGLNGLEVAALMTGGTIGVVARAMTRRTHSHPHDFAGSRSA